MKQTPLSSAADEFLTTVGFWVSEDRRVLGQERSKRVGERRRRTTNQDAEGCVCVCVCLRRCQDNNVFRLLWDFSPTVNLKQETHWETER